MTNKLSLYNLALGTYIGTERLANLTENVPSRHALDAIYDGALEYMLKRGMWEFALRTVQLTKEVTAPAFHRQHAFAKPLDFVRIARISPDARLDVPLLNYRLEGEFFYSDVDPIFLQYVSDDPAYGMDLDAWPAAFTDAVAAELAFRSLLPISKDRGDRADLEQVKTLRLDTARRQDAVDEPVKWKQRGTWGRSRTIGGSMTGTLRGLRY